MLKALLVGVSEDHTHRVIREFMLDDRTTMDNMKDQTFTDYLVEEGVNAIQGGNV